MATRLVGHKALVTGGARGIGRTIALSLAAEGADVGISYLASRPSANKVVTSIRDSDVEGSALCADVTKEADVKRLVGATVDNLGGLDILVNNVGNFLVKDVEHLSYAEWRDLIDSNVTAAFLCSKYAIPHMRKAGWGRIVSLGAAGAYGAHGPQGKAGVFAGRGGIVGLSRAPPRRGGPAGITLHAVSAG